jgi:hypothetical protein
MIDVYGAFGVMRIGRETEVLGGNLPQCHFVHHKSHMTWDRTQVTTVGSRRLTSLSYWENNIKMDRKEIGCEIHYLLCLTVWPVMF